MYWLIGCWRKSCCSVCIGVVLCWCRWKCFGCCFVWVFSLLNWCWYCWCGFYVCLLYLMWCLCGWLVRCLLLICLCVCLCLMIWLLGVRLKLIGLMVKLCVWWSVLGNVCWWMCNCVWWCMLLNWLLCVWVGWVMICWWFWGCWVRGGGLVGVGFVGVK